MARKCSICEHAKRKEIDKSLVEPNAKLRTIALRFGVSKYALVRHVDHGHIAEKIQKVAHAHEAVEVDDLLSRIHRKNKRFEELITTAKSIGSVDLELKVHHEQGNYWDREGKITGAFREKIELTGKDGTA